VGFRDESERIEAANGVVIGVSPDAPGRLARFRSKNDLPFVLLSDPDHEVAEMYGVWGEKKMYGKTFMGIIRSHFVIDEEGRVMDAQIKVSPKKSVELAVAALE
jgi:peroxiredoxin Q/BCP